MLKALCFVSLTVLSLSATGCKDITKDAEALADRACACKTGATDAAKKTCADKVVDDLVDMLKNNKHAGGDEARVQKAGERIGQCAVEAGANAEELVAKMKQFDE